MLGREPPRPQPTAADGTRLYITTESEVQNLQFTRMRLGIVDLGTLSLRFDIYELTAGERPRLLVRHRAMPRLGAEAYRTGELTAEAADRASAELRAVRRIADDHRVERIRAVGTAFLRSARGGEQLIRRLREESGIEIEPITGEEEARLTALGIIANEPSAGDGPLLLVDIGGGSTELSLCNARAVTRSVSIPLGAERLLHSGLQGRPISYPFPRDAKQRIEEESRAAVLPFAKDAPQSLTVFGSSGTVRALARLHQADGSESEVLSTRRIGELLDEMCRGTRDDLLSIPGMEERRLDFMVSGTILLVEILAAFHATEARVTKFSLRHGILEEERVRFERGADTTQ